MNRFLTIISSLVTFMVLLSACGGNGATPTIAATEAPATQAPVATEPGAASTLAPVDLAGPPMQIGSFYTYADGAVLAAVPGGPFLMGFNNFFDAKEHQVILKDFWVYTNEVTNQQFGLCVTAGKCDPPNPKDDPNFSNYRFVAFPVVGVTFDQAAAYCTFMHARLPTEAEWEKAARGENGNPFPWGDAAPSCDRLNFNFCKGKPINVESYPNGASLYGLFDMSGNVREWTADWYLPDYDISAGGLTDPLGPTHGEKRSVRSSSFADSSDFAYAAHRFSLTPNNHLPDLGFRCVVDDPTYFALYCQGLTLYGADVNGSPTNDVIPLPPDCQQSTIDVANNCQTTQDNFIKPHVAPGATLDMSGAPTCQGGPPTYDCAGSGVVTIKAQSCSGPPPPGGGSCSPGYNEQPDPNDPSKKICLGKGPGQACLPGFNFDPLTQCCAASNPGPNQFGICGPGFYQQGNTCVPANSNPPALQDVTVNFSPVPLCQRTGGGGGSCAGTCPPRQQMCASTCTCISALLVCP